MAGNQTSYYDRLVILSIVVLGISALTTQLVLMRELLSSFNGNELSIGIILGNWLLLSGIGSYTGRHFPVNKFTNPIGKLSLLHILIALVPMIEVAAIRMLRDKLFIRGSLIGITEMVISSFIVLLPFCIISGFFLVIACELASGKYSSGKVYIADSIGSSIGGLFFSFILIQVFDHFKLVSIVAALNFGWSIILSFKGRSKLLSAISGALFGITLLLIFRYDIDLFLTQKQFYGEKILFHGNSPYGRVVATEFENQINFIENGVPLSPSHNLQQVEETVHFAMAQRSNAKNVLLISGGYTGTAREILKYGVENVDYVELDTLIIKLAEKYLKENIASTKIKIINTDGRKYVRETNKKYDVIIIDVPDPLTSQINRFYTAEFYKECLRILEPDGVISFGISHYENYISDELAKVLSAVTATLKQCFKNILTVPANRVYFIASNGELISDIAGQLEKLGIQTRYVRRGYLNSIMSPDRLSNIKEASSYPGKINKDFHPTLYLYNILHWISQFRIKFGVLQAGLILFLLVYIVKLRATQLTIFASGFTGSTLEVVLLLAFQIFYGSVYLQLSIIITLFMLGLTVGAFYSKRWIELNPDSSKTHKLKLCKLAVISGAIGIFLYPILILLSKSLSNLPYFARISIPVLTFFLAFIAGSQFPIACGIESKKRLEGASKIYTADFIGASIGSLLAGTLLIPVAGVFATCLITAIFNIVCASFLFIETKKIG